MNAWSFAWRFGVASTVLGLMLAFGYGFAVGYFGGDPEGAGAGATLLALLGMIPSAIWAARAARRV